MSLLDWLLIVLLILAISLAMMMTVAVLGLRYARRQMRGMIAPKAKGKVQRAA